MILLRLRLLALILPGNSLLPLATSTLAPQSFISKLSQSDQQDSRPSPTSLLALVPNSKTTSSCEQTSFRRNPRYRFPNYCLSQLKRRDILSSTICFSDARQKLAVSGGKTDNNEYLSTKNNRITPKMKKIGLMLLAITISVLGVCNREAITSFDLKQFLAFHLDALASLGTPGLILYTFFFMLWEITLGITTPVETAAGMAFGLKKGIIASAIGKTSGALCAFLLGRSVLSNYAAKKLEGNEYMDLVRDSITKNPIRVALIWRFSFLPEFVKNFGLAILPVKTWQFLTAVLMHGFPFTILWTFMGNEMGGVVRGISKPSRILKLLVLLVYVFGFFISPTLVGLWVKSLRDEKMQRSTDLND